MQFLLTQEEFNDLLESKRRSRDEFKAALQRACTLAAKHTPITVDWRPGEPPQPWGCILDRESHPGYCDECPVRDICPNDRKKWSK